MCKAFSAEVEVLCSWDSIFYCSMQRDSLQKIPIFMRFLHKRGNPVLPSLLGLCFGVIENTGFVFRVVKQTSPISESVATRVPSKCLIGFNAVHTVPCRSSPLCPSLYQHQSQACYPFFIYEIRVQITSPSHLAATVDVDSDLQILLYHFLHNLRREKERN